MSTVRRNARCAAAGFSPRPLAALGLMWLLVAVAVANDPLDNPLGSVSPSATTSSENAPAGTFEPQSDAPAVIEQPKTAPVLPAQTNVDPEGYFPEGPPAPPPSSSPVPLSPSGRWLMSSVLVDGKVYVYGGVGSYSTALFNDLWLYNFVENSWSQLQASFVPPFPILDKKMLAPKEPEQDALPPNMPRGAATELDDTDTTQLVRMNPEEGPRGSSPSNEVAEQQTYKLVNLKPVPFSAFKPPGYTSFLELSAEERIKVTHGMSESTVPQFWKSNALSPGLMSPFIAADLWVYDLDTKLWTNVVSKSNNVPAPRWLHTAVNIDGDMVIFGGVSYSDVILGDVWVFRPASQTWFRANPLGDPILPREGHSAVVAGKTQMYVFGGVSYGHLPFNDLWLYDGEKTAWYLVQTQGTKPPARWLHTACVYADDAGTQKMFVFGGVTRNWVPLDDLWIYDFKSKVWTHPKVSGFPPFPRMMHTAGFIRERMYVHGGVANNIPLEDVWYYDAIKNEWHEEINVGAYPFAREGHTMVVIEPPAPHFAPIKRTWDPNEIAKGPDPLMPTILNRPPRRDPRRIRKEYTVNRFALFFGGAGPKPKEQST